MEDTIKIELLTPLTGTFLPNEMEQDWEEEDYNDFEEEQVFFEGDDLTEYASVIQEKIAEYNRVGHDDDRTDNLICCERAVVERSAGLFQEAIAKGDALLTGTAVMYQTSIAEESCRILAGEVWNMAHIRGFAKITAAKETGDAPLILGNSLVFGNVCGKVLVRGNVLPSRSVENQTQELLVFRGGDSIHKVNESKKKTKSKKQPER